MAFPAPVQYRKCFLSRFEVSKVLFCVSVKVFDLEDTRIIVDFVFLIKWTDRESEFNISNGRIGYGRFGRM